MSNSAARNNPAASRFPRRHSGVVAALASHTGVALQNWATRRSTVSVEELRFRSQSEDDRDRLASAIRDGLLR